MPSSMPRACHSFSTRAPPGCRRSSVQNGRAVPAMSFPSRSTVDEGIRMSSPSRTSGNRRKSGGLGSGRTCNLDVRRNFSSSSSTSDTIALTRQWGGNPNNINWLKRACAYGLTLWILLEWLADDYSFSRLSDGKSFYWTHPFGSLGRLIYRQEDVPIGNRQRAGDVVDLHPDDERVQRVRDVVDKLAYAAGVEDEAFEIVVTDAAGKMRSNMLASRSVR